MRPTIHLPDAHLNPRPEISPRPAGRARDVTRLAVGAVAALLLVAGLAGTVGCARKSGARAESREVRLTKDGAIKSALRFSPDGRSIAFARRLEGEKAMFGVFLMPVAGGDARRISPDTLGLLPLRWSGDGTAVFCMSLDGKQLYRLGLDGSVQYLGGASPLSRFFDVSDDGVTRLIVTFRQDNYDLDILSREGGTGELAPTAEWEQGGVLGPGPDQVTVVSSPTFQSPLTTISVRSRGEAGAKVLPLPDGQKYSPAWSPDGRELAYVVSDNGQLDLWIYDAATARATPAIQDPQDTACPAWSPDGEWLAFCRAVKTSRLFLGDVDAPNRRQLTNGPANDFDPKASPDGRWIAFLRRSAPGTEGAETLTLNVMPLAGGEVTELDLGGRTLPPKGSEIVWSGDSEHLAFSAREASSGLDIYRVRRDGTGLLRVTVDPGDEIDPRWSPDGRQISYTRVGGGKTQVAVLPSNGGLAHVVSADGVVSEGGAWSPDGSELAYLSIRGDGGFELWRAPVSAPGHRRLVLATHELAWPLRWTPDGKYLILVRGKGQDWYLSEYEIASGKEQRIANEMMLHSGAGTFQFLPEGDKYRDLLCPGGVLTADGEQTSDLYMIRARDLVRSRQLSAGGQGFSWFARASWVGSY